MIKFCQDRDIIVTAYCPLGRPIPVEKKPGFLYDPKLIEMGKKYGKTPAQIVFRYLVSLDDIRNISNRSFLNINDIQSFSIYSLTSELFRFQNQLLQNELKKILKFSISS